MALLSQRERDLIILRLAGPNSEEQRSSLIRELRRDDESLAEDSIDTKLALAPKR